MKKTDINQLISAYYDNELTEGELDYLLEATKKDPELLSKLKNMSESKLLKEKKDVLVDYLVTLFNKSKNEFSKKTKKDLVDNLKLEINKTI